MGCILPRNEEEHFYSKGFVVIAPGGFDVRMRVMKNINKIQTVLPKGERVVFLGKISHAMAYDERE